MKGNRIYIYLVATALLLSVVYGEEPAEKLLEPSPDFVPKPIIKTGDMAQKAFDYINKKKDEEAKAAVDMIDLKPAAKVEQAEAIKVVDPVPEPVAQKDEALPPILPILNGMSPFLKSIFAPPVVKDGQSESADFDAKTNINEHQFIAHRPHGVMTIVLVKSSKQSNGGDNKDAQVDRMPALISRIRPNLDFMLQHMLPRRISQFFASGDKDFADMERRLENDSPLLGGGGDNDIDRLRFREQHPLIGAEEHSINQDPLVIKTDKGQSAFIADDFGRNEMPARKKCMMSFMRLKASAYYRTIVHLLFFSGIILLFLFMIMLTIRVYKRRRALRYYNQNLHVATISNEDLPPKGNTFLFRSGNLRNSYAQKQAESLNETRSSLSSTLMFHAPPAYEKIISNSTKLTRQDSQLAMKKEAEEDSKSTSSLPAYNDALEKKPSDI